MSFVESWWNGYMGSLGRERVRLRHDERGWRVEHDGPGDRYEVTPCADEGQARAELARAMRPGQEWRRMDQLPQSQVIGGAVGAGGGAAGPGRPGGDPNDITDQ